MSGLVVKIILDANSYNALTNAKYGDDNWVDNKVLPYGSFVGTVNYVQSFNNIGSLTYALSGDDDPIITRRFQKVGVGVDALYLVTLTVATIANDRELVKLKNQLQLGDAITATSAAVTVAELLGGMSTALANPIGFGLAIAGGAYYIYTKGKRNELITLDKFLHGYEKTAMYAFINKQWQSEDIIHYDEYNQIFGGAQMLKWAIQSIENVKNLDIYSNNYRDMALEYVYGENAFGEQFGGLRNSRGDEIKRSYHLKFIHEEPQVLFNKLKTWQAAGQTKLVAAYLYALEQLNPVVNVNPDRYILDLSKYIAN